MVRALRIRIRNLDVIRILMNNNNKLMKILEQGTTQLDLCFKEVHLQFKEERLN